MGSNIATVLCGTLHERKSSKLFTFELLLIHYELLLIHSFAKIVSLKFFTALIIGLLNVNKAIAKAAIIPDAIKNFFEFMYLTAPYLLLFCLLKI